MEGFFGILKPEMFYLKKYNDFETLKKDIDKYIHFYNNNRLQKKLKTSAPLEYQNRVLTP